MASEQALAQALIVSGADDDRSVTVPANWFDDPYTDPGPWAAYTLGFQSRMVRTWYKLSVGYRGEARNLDTGVPATVEELRQAIAILTASASPAIICRFNAALVRFADADDAVHDGCDDPEKCAAPIVSAFEALEDLPPLADGVVPASHQLSGWYTLGAVMGKSASLPDTPPTKEDNSPLLQATLVAQRIPPRDRARVKSVADLALLADEYPTANEESLKRHLLELFRKGSMGKDFAWRMHPLRWWLELFEYHEHILNQLRHLLRIPLWDESTGELYFDGRVIRRVVAKAHDVRAILKAFQALNWKRTIHHPRYRTEKPTRLLALRNNHIHSLNEGIAANTIRFGGGGEDHLIKWELLAS